MPRLSPVQTNFTAGELSPRLLGRDDIDRYRSGAQTMENFQIMPHGGADKRMGLTHAAPAKHDNRKHILVGFEYSIVETYMLEIGHNYIRFFRNSAPIYEADVPIEDITAADPGVVTQTGHSYSDGDEFVITDIPPSGPTELNGQRLIVANSATNTYELNDRDGNNIDTSALNAYTFGGNTARVYEITTTYDETELYELSYVQSADVMYIFHNDHAVAKLSRTGNTAWSLDDAVFVDGPYLDQNTTATTLNPAATTGSGIALVASADLFDSGHVGAFFALHDGYVQIVGVSDAQNATCDVIATLSASTATADWSEGAFSDYRGHPSCGTFYEQRLILGGTTYQPQTFHGSKVGDFDDFTPGTDDDDPYNYELASQDVQAIKWMEPARVLLIGTGRGEHKVGSETTATTPSNIQARQETRHGSASIPPVKVGNVVLFLQRALRKIREMAFVFESDQYEAPDLSILSEHITKGGVLQMSWAQEPDSIVYAIRRDGQLLGMTYERAQKVVAWHRHTTNGKFESVDVIPMDSSDAEGFDQVWTSVKRKIDGNTRRTVEYFHKRYELETNQKKAFYVDNGLSLDVPIDITNATQADPVVLTIDNLADDVLQGYGDFAATGPWTLGTGWAIGSGVLTGSAGSASDAEVAGALIDGYQYKVTFTISNYSAGTMNAAAGSGGTGTSRSADGTYSEVLTCSGNTKALIQKDSSFAGDIDDVTFEPFYFQDGDQADVDSVLGMTELNGERFIIDGATATTVNLQDTGATDIDGTGYTEYDEEGEIRKVVSTVSGLKHLAGATVQVLVNGGTQSDKTVDSDGEITVSPAGSIIHVGQGYIATLKTMPLSVGAQDGTTQGKEKSWGKIMARLYRTLDLNINGEAVNFRNTNDPMNKPIPEFTGVKEVQDLGWDKEAEVTFTSELPLPCTILSVFGIAEVNDA